MEQLNFTQNRLLQLSASTEQSLQRVDIGLAFAMDTLEATMQTTIAKIEEREAQHLIQQSTEPVAMSILATLRYMSPITFYSGVVALYWLIGTLKRHYLPTAHADGSIHAPRSRDPWIIIKPTLSAYLLDCCIVGVEAVAAANLPIHQAHALKAVLFDFVTLCLRQYTLARFAYFCLGLVWVFAFSAPQFVLARCSRASTESDDLPDKDAKNSIRVSNTASGSLSLPASVSPTSISASDGDGNDDNTKTNQTTAEAPQAEAVQNSDSDLRIHLMLLLLQRRAKKFAMAITRKGLKKYE